MRIGMHGPWIFFILADLVGVVAIVAKVLP